VQIHSKYRRAYKHRAAHDEPLRQVGIDNRVENMHQKRPVRGFDACTGFKPRFKHSERARQPRNQLDHDGVNERSNVERPKKGAAACHCPAQHDPGTPK